VIRARAPGKLLLAGAWAVLDGAPALVCAVDRHAVADTSRRAAPSREVRAALGDDPAPAVDVTALHDAATKLGLGSSAAALVATLGALEAQAGADLESEVVRARIFERARAAHAAAQGGGSGVDVAASVYGGTLRYVKGARPTKTALPSGIVLRVYFAGTSARTSELRARVGALSAAQRAARICPIANAAEAALDACARGDASALVRALRATGAGIEALGHAADVQLVPPPLAHVASLAAAEEAAFLPSGAGGGDVSVWLGPRPPSSTVCAALDRIGARLVPLSIDFAGVSLL
jgi:phosphomevalonate kinase